LRGLPLLIVVLLLGEVAHAGTVRVDLNGVGPALTVSSGEIVIAEIVIDFGPTTVSGSGANYSFSVDYLTGAGSITNVETHLPSGWISPFNVTDDGASRISHAGNGGVSAAPGAQFPDGSSFLATTLSIDTSGLEPGTYSIVPLFVDPGVVEGVYILVGGNVVDLTDEYAIIPGAITVTGNPVTADSAIVMGSTRQIFRVDLTTGERTLLREFTGVPEVSSMNQLIVEDAEHLLVLESSTLWRYDLVSGSLDVVSTNHPSMTPVGSGPELDTAFDVLVEPEGTALVLNRGSNPGAILRVDLATGDRTLVSCSAGCAPLVGSGPAFGGPWNMAREASGTLVVSRNGEILRVDPSTGDRTTLTNASVGGGLPVGGYEGIAVEADGNMLVVDDAAEGIIRVDATTGFRSIFSDPVTDEGQTGGGDGWDNPVDVGIAPSGTVIVVDSGFQEGLLSVDAMTGDRTFFSGCVDAPCAVPVGAGPVFDDPFRVSFAPSTVVSVPLGGAIPLALLVVAMLGTGTAAVRSLRKPS